jgi:glycosyltransferase involved in cell wall biosynthesis
LPLSLKALRFCSQRSFVKTQACRTQFKNPRNGREKQIFGWRFRKAEPGLLIVDPSLIRRAGHPFHAARSVAEAAAEAGLEALVLGNAGADRAVRSGLRFRGCFSRSLYMRERWSMAVYESEAALLAKEMARLLGRRSRAVAAIVMPTCDQAQLRALANLIAAGTLPRTVAILGWLLLPPRWDVDPEAAGGAAQIDEYRDALARIETARGGPGITRLCFETAALRGVYGGLPGAEILLAPSPSPSDLAGADRKPEGRRHFVVLGHAAPSKGYELLPEALRAALAADDRVTFTIHGVVEGAGNPAASEILEALSRLGPRVRVLTHELASEDYFTLLGSADVLLLPYRLPDYRDRGSGIFNEAVRHGIPVVAPAGSAFAQEQIRDCRAVALREHSALALAKAIAEAARDLALLRANCRAHLSQDRGPSVLADFLRGAASDAR